MSVLTACANTPIGKQLERSIAADPNLKDNSTILGGGSSPGDRQLQTSVKPPKDFPAEIPLYPNAQLQNVESLTGSSGQGQLTRWSSSDPINLIENFYQRAFATNQWQIISKPTDTAGGTLVARQKDLEVTVTIPASATPNQTPASPQTKTNASVTAFTIQYVRNNASAASPTANQPEVAKPVEPASTSVAQQPTPESSASSGEFSDIDKLPQGLRQQVEDLVALGVLTVDKSSSKENLKANDTQFEPNKTITRREFARWLVAANNQIFANRPGQQIRLASDSSQPAFPDIPRSDRDFKSIQALAEAGLIPSPLSGDSSAALFRPDAPLTRETLIAWKVPLDTRQALPTASLDTVKQTWGFQDVAKIDPKALRAVVADFQNGEQSNIRRVFGYTTLFQPKKPVTRAEAATAIWYFGTLGEGLSAREALKLKNQPTQPAAKLEATPSNSTKQ